MNNLQYYVDSCKTKAGSYSASELDALFFSLPYWDVYAPFSAVPCLVGALREKGLRSKGIDVGILYFHILFEKNRRIAKGIINSKYFYRQRVLNYEKSGVKTYEEYIDEIKILTDNSLSLGDLRRIFPELNDFQRGILGFFYDLLWMGRRKTPNRRKLNLTELAAGLDFGLFFDVISRFDLFPLLNNLPPLVGISITSLDQLAASCLWARFIRLLNSKVKILAGGSCLIILEKCNSPTFGQLFDYFDYVCIGEGETCVTRLTSFISHSEYSPREIPNLVYRENGDIIFNQKIVEDVASIPPPCYDDVDFSLYLTPEPMLSYQTSRGCFWGRCAFCDHDKSWRMHFRQKPLKKVIQELAFLREKHQIKNFTFVDEAVEPGFFAQFVEALEQEPFLKDIKWLVYLRVSPRYSPELAKKAKKCGCAMAMFGVESFNQRLLKFIRKGILAETAMENLKMFHESGIQTHAWLLALLPSETYEELVAEFEKIKENMKYMDSSSMAEFMLYPSTDMFDNLELFNIIKVNDPADLDIDWYDFISKDINGKTIDSSDLSSFLNKEMRPYIARKICNTNRYITFFNQAYYKS